MYACTYEIYHEGSIASDNCWTMSMKRPGVSVKYVMSLQDACAKCHGI